MIFVTPEFESFILESEKGGFDSIYSRNEWSVVAARAGILPLCRAPWDLEMTYLEQGGEEVDNGKRKKSQTGGSFLFKFMSAKYPLGDS